MLRWLFGLLAAVSLLLGVGAATMWLRQEPRVQPPPLAPLPVALVAQTRAAGLFGAPAPVVDLAEPIGGLPPFRGSRLYEVFGWLLSASDEVNWPAIEATGIGQDTPVPRGAVSGSTLGSTLTDVLTPLGLSFATDGHSIYVSTPADVERFGHMRHVDRFAFTTRADATGAAAVDADRRVPFTAQLTGWFGPLGRQLGVRFEPDWPAMRASGVDPEAPSAWQDGAPAGIVLEETLREASATSPLRYQISRGRVVISTAAALESAERARIRIALEWMVGLLAAYCVSVVATRGRAVLGRVLCVSLVLMGSTLISIPIWRARPDAISARLGRSRWTVSTADHSFVLSRGPDLLEEVFLTHRSAGAARAVYCDRLGFYAAREGPPYQVFNARAPGWVMIVMLFALPVVWSVLNGPPALRRSLNLRELLRARAGRCLHCGYDLRASAGRCPECGAPGKAARAGATSTAAGRVR